MVWCEPCDRYFSTYAAYEQHVDNSSAHIEWECDTCDRCFRSEQSLKQHKANASLHYYCTSCDRSFQNQNGLTQHLRSAVHVGYGINCPFCDTRVATASGLMTHLESGRCGSGLDRHKIAQIVRRLDTRHTITMPLLTYGEEPVETWATSASWNGDGYECYLCHREFTSLSGLNSHLKSPVHEQSTYRCPNRGCQKKFTTLAGLVGHIESEACGLARFHVVQSTAQSGLQNMVGRMIKGY